MSNRIFDKEDIELAIHYIESFIGRPYHWGGNDPGEGFDCSGLAVEYLMCLGTLGPNEDYTAAGLCSILAEKIVPERGCLVYWGKSRTRITHVEILLSPRHTVGASGGGRHTLTVEDAIQHDAFTKVRPLRPDHIAISYPHLKG